MKLRFNNHKNNAGLTLVEILVAVSIFSLLSVVVSGIYVAFSNSQARATRAQRLLNDAQFALVGMAREIRNNELYYGFGLTAVDCNAEIKTEPDISVESCIFLRKNDGTFVAFAKETDSNKLDYLVKDPVSGNWSLTGFVFNDGDEGVEINNLNFNFYPALDPQIEGNENRQPFVMIQVQVNTTDTNIYKRVSYNLQTSVSSRAYKR